MTIFFEGMPGSGKSTAAEHLAGQLRLPLFTETDPANPLLVGSLDGMGAAMADVHLRFQPEDFVAAVLEKYKNYKPPPGHVIFEAYPIQTHVRVLLQMDAPVETISSFWWDVQEAMQHLKPLLVYFHEYEPAEAILEISERRGPEWTNYVVGALEQSPYMQARGLRGLTGVAQMMVRYNELLRTAVQTWWFPKLVLTSRPPSYEDRNNEILTWFEMECLRN